MLALALLVTLSCPPSQQLADWIPHCTTAELERIYFARTNLSGSSRPSPGEAFGIHGEVAPELEAALARVEESLAATWPINLAAKGVWRSDALGLRTFELPEPVVMDTVVLFANGAPSVRRGRVEVHGEGGWVEYASGTFLGDPYTVRGEPRTVDGVRLRSSESLGRHNALTLELYASPPRVTIAPDWRLLEDGELVEVACSYPGAELELAFEGPVPPAQIDGPSGAQRSLRLAGTTTVRARAKVAGRAPGPWSEARFVLAAEAEATEPLSLFIAPRPGLKVVPRNDPRVDVKIGYINAPQAGVYRIGLRSEHPAWLELHGKRLLLHPGHGLGRRSAAIALKAGWHPLHLETHAETNSRPTPAVLEWSGPGFDFRAPLPDHLGN